MSSLTSIKEAEGDLIPIEFSELPFVPKRIFIVKDVPRGTVRGKHAHKKCVQVLVCLQGAIKVTRNMEQTLLLPGEYILVPIRTWCEQEYITGNDMLLSICSEPYDKDDYIYYLSELT